MPHFFTSFRFALASRTRPNVRAHLLQHVPFVRAQWFLLLLLVAVGVVYLIEINLVTMRGYELGRLQRQQKEFLDVKSSLLLEATELRTLASLERRLQEQQFVKAGKETYLQLEALTMK